MYADPHLSDTTRLFSTKEQRFPQFSFRERHGGIAQLGERMTGSHEVSGSIPLISTKTTARNTPCGGFLRFIALYF